MRNQTNLGFEEKLLKAASHRRTDKSDFIPILGSNCGSEAVEDYGEAFAVKSARLRSQLTEQFEQSARMQAEITRNLQSIGVTQ